MKFRTLHLVIIAAFLVVSGYVHGKWTNRWTGGSGDVVGKDLLSGLDSPIGNFQPGDFQQVNPAELPPKTQCHSRRFQPLKSGKQVLVSLTSGSPGSVAVHTPDVCYLGAGWKLRSAATRQTIALADGGVADFWTADFTKTSATGIETIRVRWAWSADGSWQAPDYPRLKFSRAPILYKLYVVHNLSEEDDLTREDPYRTFTAALIPILSRQLNDAR